MTQGSYRRLSAGRKIVAEILHHGRKLPTLTTARRTNVAALMAARVACPNPPSWLALFIKAYGLCAQSHPELRTAWIAYPWPRLYLHPHTICTVPVERRVDGEDVVLAAKIVGPENHSLAQIHGHLQRFRTAPVWDISDFRQLLRLGRAPALFRRLAFWHTLHWSGSKRAKRFGTCSVSSLGQYGAEQIHPITPLTTYLSAGPIESDGAVNLKIIYDHRVMDDSPVARCLVTLEEILNGPIVAELEPQRAHAVDIKRADHTPQAPADPCCLAATDTAVY